MRPPSYHGTTEEIRKVREKRNAEIRAWGKEQLRLADEVLLGVPTAPLDVSDWDQIVQLDDDDEIAISPEPILEELPQEIEKIVKEVNPTTAKSRAKATPKG